MATPTTTIGNFQLLRTLGEGGMGVVFEAEHVTMHRRAAIKVLRSELIRDEQAIRRFFNEARATNEIRHPGIVQIYDCGTRDDGSPWLIMELLEGETLSRRIERLGRVSAAEVIVLGAQTASVLEAAHRAGIIHRDLKPDNLFIVNNQETPSGERVKVLDFGIAKLTSTAAAKSMHTQTGMLMGTPLYMSPEQCRGTGQIDARSDIYSFGLILYQMVCGELPFVSEGMGELFDMQMNRPPPPLERKEPGVMPALAQAIYRALRKDPAERFQSMAELQRALLAVNDAPTSAARAPAPMPAPTPAPASSAVRTTGREGGNLGDGGQPSHTLPVASTTLSAGAMELDPIKVPRNRLGRPLLIAGALLLGGGALFAVRSLTGARTPAAGESGGDPSSIEPAGTKPTGRAGAGPSLPAAAIPAARLPAKSTPTPTPHAPPAPPRPVEHPAPAPARITIDIRTSPPEARVIATDDGHLIGVTPLHQTWERKPGSLSVRIEKPGYLPKGLTVPQHQDFRGSIRLERAGEREPREPSSGEHIIKL